MHRRTKPQPLNPWKIWRVPIFGKNAYESQAHAWNNTSGLNWGCACICCWSVKTFCPPAGCIMIPRLRYTALQCCLVFYFSMKVCIRNCGTNTGWGCSRAAGWVRYWESNGRLEKIAQRSTSLLYPLPMLAVQIQGSDMGRACSTHEGEENCVQGIVAETRRKETVWKTWAWVGVWYNVS
jgi:hypothetical protein